jgi:hypothetical protein
MSTRSTIALEYAGNVIKKIYCHYDGYISHMGVTLLEHYPTRKEVQSLIDDGDLSGIDMKGQPRHYQGEEPMFPDVYTYESYVASIDHTFHEFNYLLRLNGKWEVISAHYDNKSKSKVKMLTKCVGAWKRVSKVNKS